MLVVREAFNHRRKTLRSIFKTVATLPVFTDEDFNLINISPMARPENLSVADFVQLSDMALSKITNLNS